MGQLPQSSISITRKEIVYYFYKDVAEFVREISDYVIEEIRRSKVES